ncbi:hypothetical protein DFH11DRAFT_647569 [Phellopilus nigrolimitatus]|nr:hypothetical protein DFH11DRAFT_647569 [Phellopilus nigrolimitatus]
MANSTCAAAGLSTTFCEEFATLERSFVIIQGTKWTNMAALAMFLYDYIVTFDEEVMLMWGSAMSAGKALFFLNRYFTLATLIFINAVMCLSHISIEVTWIRVNWIAGIIATAFAELTLQLRLYAMYDRTREILVLLIWSFTTTVGAMLGISIKLMEAQGEYFARVDFPAVSLYYGDGFAPNTCIRKTLPKLFKMFWVPLLVNEALLFGLAVYKGFPSLWRGPRTGNRLIRFLVRDSVLFFFMVFATFLANEVVWLIGGPQYIETLIGLAIANASIWSQRLLLNIRMQYMGHQAIIIEGDLRAIDYSDSSLEMSQCNDHDIVLSTFRTLNTRKR